MRIQLAHNARTLPKGNSFENGLARVRRTLGNLPVPQDGLDIIYFSNGALSEELWINTHRVGIELARCHRVLFVEQPQQSLLGLRRLPNLKEMSRRLQGFTALPGGLTVFSPLDILPTGRLGPQAAGISRSLTRRLIVRRVRREMVRLGFHHPILWLYHGEQYPLIGSFGERLIVYDCVDEYTTFPSVKTDADRARIDAAEGRLLRSADIVFATTRSLADRKRSVNPNTHFVPNVGDVAHFGRVYQEHLRALEEIERIPRPRIGFIGAFARFRIDFGLVDWLARERPEWSFIMIGPVTDEEGSSVLPRRSNLYWLGAREYEDLPAHIAGFDACFLPYDVNVHTRNAFPLKFHEFLATGKPIVATPLPALEEYGHVVPLARTREDFVAALKAIVDGQDTKEAKDLRLAVAAANSWEHRVGRMTEIIRRHHGRNMR